MTTDCFTEPMIIRSNAPDLSLVNIKILHSLYNRRHSTTSVAVFVSVHSERPGDGLGTHSHENIIERSTTEGFLHSKGLSRPFTSALRLGTHHRCRGHLRARRCDRRNDRDKN